MSVLVSGWVATTPVLWAHRWEQAALAALIGLGGLFLSPAVVLYPRARTWVGVLGAILALSSFAFPDTFATTIDNLSAGLLLIIAGVSPEVRVLEPVRQIETAFQPEASPRKAA
jgi:hypothetical protein